MSLSLCTHHWFGYCLLLIPVAFGDISRSLSSLIIFVLYLVIFMSFSVTELWICCLIFLCIAKAFGIVNISWLNGGRIGFKMYFLINHKTMKNITESTFLKAEILNGTLGRVFPSSSKLHWSAKYLLSICGVSGDTVMRESDKVPALKECRMSWKKPGNK